VRQLLAGLDGVAIVGGSGQAGFGEEATKADVRNPQSTIAVQMVGIAERVIPMADFGKTSAGQFDQGTDALGMLRCRFTAVLSACRSPGLAERNG
jgi:hypothetical protein